MSRTPYFSGDDWEEDEDGGLMLPEYYDDDQYADDALDYNAVDDAILEDGFEEDSDE